MREVLIVLAGVVVLTLAAQLFAFFILRRAVDHPGHAMAQSLVRHLRAPTQLVAPLIGLEIALPHVDIGRSVDSDLLHWLGVALIFSLAFLVVRLTYVFDDIVLGRYRIDAADNLKARQIQTQVQVLRRVAVVIVSVLSVSVALLTFPSIRAAGAGLLASAGLLGLVVGIAARPIVTNVLAGLQIAISQPIRIDDVVVIEGDWGRIEQIALTYVVVRVWDQRRLIVPISYFIENPFENWTRRTADIVGWVYIDVDYTAPVDALRRKLLSVLEASPDWDGKVWTLQVTSAGAATIQLRALMSSADSQASWNLQCEVREKLIAFLQAEHPDALPRQRNELVGAGSPDTGTSKGIGKTGHRPVSSWSLTSPQPLP